MLRDSDKLAWVRMLLLRRAPGGDRVTAVHAARHAAELLLDLAQLPQRNRQQAVRAQRDALVELQFPLEGLAPDAEGGLRPRRKIRLEISNVAPDRRCRFG